MRRRRHGHRLLVTDPLDPIHQGHIQISRHKASADPLDLVGTGLEGFARHPLADHRAGIRFHRYRHQGFAQGLFDVPAHAGDCAAGANPGHEHVHGAIGIGPDFRSSGVVVNLWIGRVNKLL
jgi:hypothetical protein